MIAANIGAGSTIGAASLAYRDGISAWWWVGSAGLGSLVFAFAVAPRLWRVATEHNFYTTGDYLEFRYGTGVRCVATVLVGLGTLALLAGQLIAGAAILTVLTGAPRWLGALLGGGIMTIYFTAGGLLGSAWVNTVQFVVMMTGFAVALPIVIERIGGFNTLGTLAMAPWFTDITYSAGPGSGWTLLALTGPAFIVSPGLIQKSWGAASEGALRRGVAANAVVLLLFAFIPVLFGMAGRAVGLDVGDANAVLPTVLTMMLPAWIGALALSAVFSTEVDTCDAILFMLSTSAAKDFYKRFIAPDASDERLLRVARLTAFCGGAIGVLLAIWLDTVVGALTIFYSLLVVTLFVPVLGGLYLRRAGQTEALVAIVTGVGTLFTVRLVLNARYPWLDPTLSGIIIATIAFAASAAARGQRLRT